MSLMNQKTVGFQILMYLNSTLDLTVFAISAMPVQDLWTPTFVMIVEISTEHRALNHIPFIYLIFLENVYRSRSPIGPVKILDTNFERLSSIVIHFRYY